MELIIRRSALPASVLLLLALLLPAPAAAAGTRFNLALGVTGTYPFESLMRDIYGDFLTGYQAQLSFRFAGRWSVFAGYRSIRAAGQPLVLGESFEVPDGSIDMDLNSWRGGFLYDLTQGRWTFSFAVGVTQVSCSEAWPAADLSAKKRALGGILAVGTDFALFGPLGLFVRLEACLTERKEDILLGGLDAVAGLSLRF
jgi:hypothetical protein